MILEILGVEDFGIYNVVGGVIGLLSFLNSSMASTYQRYFNFEMGRKNETALIYLFKSSITVQLIYAIIIVVLAETIGLWFLNTQIVIPIERITAARWVYQVSILSFVLTVFQAPFTALIISNEKMNIFAIVSILDATLKLVIIFLLPYTNNDKLIAYAILLILITLLDLLIYVVICKKKFSSCKIALNWDKDNLKSLINFGGWGMVGSLAYTLKSQGINIILNMFFGPIVNAARGISYQILSAVEMFTTNFQTSFRPQLIKSYAEGNLDYMYKLYYSATKISFYMLWCISLPIIIETPMILSLWLGNNVPEYTVVFTRLILLTALVSAYANPTSAIAYATGNIKRFISNTSPKLPAPILLLIIQLLNTTVPIGYFFLKLGYDPESTMIISLIMTILVQIVRLFVLKKLLYFSILDYIKKVCIPTFLVFLLSPIMPYCIKRIAQDSLIYSLLICLISAISVVIFMWFIGLNKEEKNIILSKIRIRHK